MRIFVTQIREAVLDVKVSYLGPFDGLAHQNSIDSSIDLLDGRAGSLNMRIMF